MYASVLTKLPYFDLVALTHTCTKNRNLMSLLPTESIEVMFSKLVHHFLTKKLCLELERTCEVEHRGPSYTVMYFKKPVQNSRIGGRPVNTVKVNIIHSRYHIYELRYGTSKLVALTDRASEYRVI